LLLCSVASGAETQGRSGLPLIGLIPIIGRLFTAPTRDNRQIDIVIAVTPRVIRAPAILPEDEVERPTGSIAVPTSSSLEAMMIDEERGELLAAARRVPNASDVQLPDRQAEQPAYVKTDGSVDAVKTATGSPDSQASSVGHTDAGDPVVKPIDNSVKTLNLNQTADTSKEFDLGKLLGGTAQGAPNTGSIAAATADIRLGSDLTEMKAGERVRIPILVQGTEAFRSAVLGLKFDDKKIAVRSVSFGDVFGSALMNASVTPFLNQNGKMYVSLTTRDGNAISQAGILAFIEIEALTAGKPEIALDKDVLNFLTLDGKNFAIGTEK
jgi:hypothetical protein